MALVSKIYGSNQILFKAGSRKGKSKTELALMVEKQKIKKNQNPVYIRWLEEKLKKEKRRN